MKLSQWAKQQGIAYITAYRWFKAGKLSNAKQMDNGTILIDENINVNNIEQRLDRIENMLEQILKNVK